MPTERRGPKKRRKSIRPPAEVSELIRCLQETRMLAAEISQLLRELGKYAVLARKARRAPVLKLPD